MRIIVLSVMLLYGLVFSVRAEDEWGVAYTLPSKRSWLGKIVPTKENIPEIDTWGQKDTLEFEGPEFCPKRWFSGNIQISDVSYYHQWGLPDTNWKLRFPKLDFFGYTATTTIAERNGVRFGFEFALRFP